MTEKVIEEKKYTSDVLKRENCLEGSFLFFIMFHSWE